MSDCESLGQKLSRSSNRKGLSKTRSRVTNGEILLAEIDGRSTTYRRFKDIVRQMEADQGGDLSEARMQLTRRFAACACLAEKMEAAMCRGEKISIDEHAKLVSGLVRVARRIGVDRIPKDVSHSLRDYLSQNPVGENPVGENEKHPPKKRGRPSATVIIDNDYDDDEDD